MTSLALMAVTHPRLSRLEFEMLLEKSGWSAPIEHLGGEVVVTPPAGGTHSHTQLGLIAILRDWQRAGGDDGLILADVFVLIVEDTLGPDVAYWSGARRPAIPPGRVDAVPDLVVEIASPSTQANDLGPKRHAYAAAGVREQWLVDPARREIGLVDAADRSVTLREADRLTSVALPGFSATVIELLGDD